MKPFLVFFFLLLVSFSVHVESWNYPPLVKKEERRSLVFTEYGEISAVDIGDGSRKGPYHLQFITLEPNALFLPVLLHADMVFYVHTGILTI